MSQRSTLIYTALVTGCLLLAAVLLFPDCLFEVPEYGRFNFLKDTNTEMSVSDEDLHTSLRVFDQRHKLIVTHNEPTFDSMNAFGKYFKNGPEGVTVNIKEVNIFNPFFAEELSDFGIDCGNLKKESDCNSASGCVWCKSGAIPSRCYTQELAKKLPSGVFTCDEKSSFQDDEVVGRMKGIHLEVTLDSVSSVSATENLSDKKKLCDPNVGQAAGYFRLGNQEKHYFFWFFESRNKPSSDPVILWMTGGPGCSSELALFVENGPCTITADGKDTKLNPYSWNNNASIIFIDQPAGTGFSYGTYDTTEEAVGSDMDLFLREFFAKFKKFAGNKFFVFGESYAGHYVPATAHAVWKANKSKKDKINLAGIGIGNGLTDPEIQYQYYADMAYNSSTAPARVSYVTYKLMKAATPACIKAIQKCNEQGGDWSCVAAANFCNAALFEPYGASGYNPYDMRIKCDVPGLCYDFSAISKYLSQTEVLDYLGVDQSKRNWESCDAGAHEALMGDWMKNYQSLIPDLLHDRIPVLVYAGDVDYIVNYLGCRAWPMELEWKGKSAYVSEVEHEWTVNKKPAGKLRSHGLLSFLQVYQAGHMVPMDKPKEALDMVNQFMMDGELHST